MPHPEFKPTETENGHEWGVWKHDDFESCAKCYAIRRADRQNGPCHGRAKVETRGFISFETLVIVAFFAFVSLGCWFGYRYRMTWDAKLNPAIICHCHDR